MQKLLLVLITLALAALPLRGAWSIPDIAATDTESHCAQMQHASQDTGSMAGTQQPDHGADADRDCEQGCNGNCCDDSCNTCAVGTTAISGTPTLTPEVTVQTHKAIIPVAIAGQIVIPLLRPPAALIV